MDYTRHAFGLALQHPLGLGPGRTEETYSNGSSVERGKVGAHDTYVQVLSDYGWLAFASFACILLFCGSRIRRLAKRQIEELGLSFVWLFSALIGCAALAMFQDILFWPFPWLLPALAMAALAANKQRNHLQAAA
jgi:O-antigen ligase